MLEKIKKIINQDKKSPERIIPGAKVLRGNERAAIQEYIDELDFAIKNDEIHNVSLSGGYGTGKSSIIKTYIEERENKKQYIIISIGSFLKYKTTETESSKGLINTSTTIPKEDTIEPNNKTQKEDDDSDGTINMDELNIVDKIEESILKQLVHINCSNEMPYSSIKRIRSKSRDTFFMLILFFVIVNFLLFFTFYKAEFIFNIFYSSLFNKTLFNFLEKLSSFYVILFFFSIMFCIFTLIKKIINSAITSKIKTEAADIELKNIDDLPFNKKIFEIMYFFSQNRIEVVFFEDIDRFSKNIVMLVMEELKELNNIINSSTTVRKKVTFVYEFRDNIFEDYQKRNKFYDYNISMMPLSTKVNSIYLLDGLCSNENINFDLIRIVSEHLTDYRTMTNILNDYKLFKANLKTKENNELFAVMVYKNIYIDEYNQLHSTKNNLDNKIKGINAKIRKQLDKIEEELTDIEFLKNNDIIESDAGNNFLYILPYNLYVKDSEGNVLCKDETESPIPKEVFLRIQREKDFDWDKYKCEDEYLLQKTRRVSEKLKDSQLSNYITDLEKNKEILKSRPNKETIQLMSDANDGKLDSELIISGYLNDKYLDYISRPVNNAFLNSDDWRYISRVSHGFVAGNLPIAHPQSIIKYMNPNNYSNLRNYDMISYLCNKKDLNSGEFQFLKKLLLEFKDLSLEKFEFLNSYLKSSKQSELALFIGSCFVFFDISESIGELYIKMKKHIDIDIEPILLEILKLKELALCQYSYNFIREFINENSKILLNCDLENNNVVNNLIFLKIRVKDVTAIVNNSDKILPFIYDNNLYSFSPINIKIMNLDFSPKNEKYEKYVFSSLQLFFDEGYKLNRSLHIEKEKVINQMLKENIDISSKRELMRREKFTTDFFEKELLDEVYERNHIKVEWKSLKSYYKKCVEKGERKPSVIIDRVIKLIINNLNELFKSLNQKDVIDDDEFNQKLILKLLEKDYIEEAEMYLRSLKDRVIIIKKIDNLDNEAIEFGIKNDLLDYNNTNMNHIMGNTSINTENKKEFLENIYKAKGQCSILQKIKSNEELTLMFLMNKPFSEQLDLLTFLDLSSTTLLNVYPLIFKKKKKYNLTLRQYNKIISGNESLFNIKKDGRIRIISIK